MSYDGRDDVANVARIAEAIRAAVAEALERPLRLIAHIVDPSEDHRSDYCGECQEAEILVGLRQPYPQTIDTFQARLPIGPLPDPDAL